MNIFFQRLIVSIVSSPDEDGDISLKDSQSLLNVISLLAHHLEPDGQQVTLQALCNNYIRRAFFF